MRDGGNNNNNVEVVSQDRAVGGHRPGLIAPRSSHPAPLRPGSRRPSHMTSTSRHKHLPYIRKSIRQVHGITAVRDRIERRERATTPTDTDLTLLY